MNKKLLLLVGIVTVLGGNSLAATVNSNQVLGNSNKVDYMTNSNLVGNHNEVVGGNNTTIGDHNDVAGYSNITIGNNIYSHANPYNKNTYSPFNSEGKGNIAIGDHTKIDQEANTAIGHLAQAWGNASVAVGAYSMAFNDVHKTDSKYAGVKNNKGVFSIGSGYSTLYDMGAVPPVEFQVFTRQLQNVGAGEISATSTDAVNGSQLYDVLMEAKNHTIVQSGDDNIIVDNDNGIYTVSASKNLTGMNSVGLTDGNNESSYTPEGISITYRGSGTNNDEYHTSYKFDGVRIKTNDGDANPINEISLTDDGLNNGGKTIINVARGNKDTDAVNVSQLNEVNHKANDNKKSIDNHESRITTNENAIKGLENNVANIGKKVLDSAKSYTDSEVAKVGAASAALAALHPLDFDPDHKLDIMAGYGHYRNANAGAIGVAYRPNEDLLFTAGTTLDSNSVAINAGISYKVGARSEVSRSKVAMAKDLADAKREIAELKADNEKFKAILNAVLGLDLPQDKNVVFPDIEENHWAYVAVDDLAKRGLLVGYPDGTFKGDRAVTRYEFAEVIHRAIEKAKELGQTVDSRLIEEFKPELMRYAVVGKKLERVHVNKSTKEVKRDQYGTIITK